MKLFCRGPSYLDPTTGVLSFLQRSKALVLVEAWPHPIRSWLFLLAISVYGRQKNRRDSFDLKMLVQTDYLAMAIVHTDFHSFFLYLLHSCFTWIWNWIFMGEGLSTNRTGGIILGCRLPKSLKYPILFKILACHVMCLCVHKTPMSGIWICQKFGPSRIQM